VDHCRGRVAVAVALNADSFAVADSLARDPTLRASVTAAAAAYAKDHPNRPPAPPADAKPGESKKDDGNVPKGDAQSQIQHLNDEIESIRGFGWPIGWDTKDKRTMPWPKDDFEKVGAWLMKFLGWIVTAAAITLGAPFWFDVLNRFIVIRSTVKPTEKSQDEPPIDRPASSRK